MDVDVELARGYEAPEAAMRLVWVQCSGWLIPTPRHEVKSLVLELAKSNFMSAALLYEACGNIETAAEMYRKLLTCLHRQKPAVENRRNVEAVATLLSPLMEQCKSKIKILEGVGSERFIYMNI